MALNSAPNLQETFGNLSVSNCTIYPLGYAHSPVAGIALETVDGAHIMGISISNITMQSAMCPIFLCLGNRGRAQRYRLQDVFKM